MNHNINEYKKIYLVHKYSPDNRTGDFSNSKLKKELEFHKTLPKSGLQMHWISVRFYEMSDSSRKLSHSLLYATAGFIKSVPSVYTLLMNTI